MKTCFNCEISKEEKEFNKCSKNEDGLRIECRACQTEYQRNIYKNSKQKDITIKNKKCKICGKTKNISEFNKHKSSKDGLRYLCRECQSEKRKAYHAKEENKERSNKQSVKYYENNKEKVAKRVEKNKDKRNKNYSERNKNDIQFRLMSKYHKQIYSTIRVNSHNDKYYNRSLQCKRLFFMNWMKFQFGSNMSWDNYVDKWEVEHVIPFSVFDLTKKDEVEICCHWTNLQPMCKVKNKKKRDKIVLVDIMNSIIMSHRYIQKTNSKKAYEIIKKKLKWLKEKLN